MKPVTFNELVPCNSIVSLYTNTSAVPFVAFTNEQAPKTLLVECIGLAFASSSFTQFGTFRLTGFATSTFKKCINNILLNCSYFINPL